LETKKVRLNSLCLWFYNADCKFFYCHQFFGSDLKADLWVIKSRVIACFGRLNVFFDEVRSVLIFNWALDCFQKRNSDFCRKIICHM
jgi:hypothetical protein